MKYYKASTKHLCGVWLIILHVSVAPFALRAQSWKWSVGPAVTQYQFTNSKGFVIDGIRPGTGMFVELAQHRDILDSTNQLAKSSSSALFFKNHPALSHFLSSWHYELGINYQQLNAVGEIQQISMAYQANYVGFQISLGPQLAIGKGFFLGASGVYQGQYFLGGHQFIDAHYYDLSKQIQFTSFKHMGGWQIDLSKQIQPKIRVFVQARHHMTWNSPNTPSGQLDFLIKTFSMGLSIHY